MTPKAPSPHPPDGDWRTRAACLGADPRLFTDPRPGTDDTHRALTICGGCVVRDACLEHALATGERYGVWGGTSEHERRPLLRARRRVA